MVVLAQVMVVGEPTVVLGVDVEELVQIVQLIKSVVAVQEDILLLAVEVELSVARVVRVYVAEVVAVEAAVQAP
jgi:hypothetical protein